MKMKACTTNLKTTLTQLLRKARQLFGQYAVLIVSALAMVSVFGGTVNNL